MTRQKRGVTLFEVMVIIGILISLSIFGFLKFFDSDKKEKIEKTDLAIFGKKDEIKDGTKESNLTNLENKEDLSIQTGSFLDDFENEKNFEKKFEETKNLVKLPELGNKPKIKITTTPVCLGNRTTTKNTKIENTKPTNEAKNETSNQENTRLENEIKNEVLKSEETKKVENEKKTETSNQENTKLENEVSKPEKLDKNEIKNEFEVKNETTEKEEGKIEDEYIDGRILIKSGSKVGPLKQIHPSMPDEPTKVNPPENNGNENTENPENENKEEPVTPPKEPENGNENNGGGENSGNNGGEQTGGGENTNPGDNGAGTTEPTTPENPGETNPPVVDEGDKEEKPENPTEEDKEKQPPVISVAKLEVDEDLKKVTLTYTKDDKDTTFVKILVKIYKDTENYKNIEPIKTIESDLNNLNLDLTDLDYYVPYVAETTVVYNLGENEETKVLEKIEKFEITPKMVEFRNVTSKDLFKVDTNGNLVRVTGLENIPNDKENYVVKLVNDGKEFVMPVSEFKEQGEKIVAIIKHPKLSHFETDSYKDNFEVAFDKIVSGPGIYTTFESLISAMKANPNGEFKIGADMYANTTSDATYLNTFSGKLKSIDGKRYTIYNLIKPLVKSLAGGTIENIDFKNVNIISNDTSGVIASSSNGGTISSLSVQGNLEYKVANQNTHYIGGIVGLLNGGTVEKNYVDLNLKIADKDTNNVSALVGKAFGHSSPSEIKNNYVTGKIETATNPRAIVSALLSGAYATNPNNNISTLDVNMTGTGVTGINNKKVGDGITKEEAEKEAKKWGVPVPTKNTEERTNTDFSQARNYDASKEVAYHNSAKLLPLYDKNTVVKYGNLIKDGTNLATKKIKDITTMSGKDFNTNIFSKDLNKIFVQYEDGSSEIMDITLKGDFKNTSITEYTLQNDLLFTPNKLTENNSSFINELVGEFNNVSFDSDSIRNTLRLREYNAKEKERNPNKKDITLEDLYLQDSFNEIKADLNNIITKILANNDVTSLENEAVKRELAKKLKDNKEKILLGLTYLNRLYNINFGNFNIKELMLYKPSFYGKDIDNIDWLINIGKEGVEKLFIYNNVSTFANTLSTIGSNNLIDFLDKNRNLFVPEKDANTWFKESTKAFIHEQNSEVLADSNVEVYNRLTAKKSYESYILPLLNLKEDNVYVVTNLSSIFFGGYGRIVDTALKNTNPTEYNQKIEEAKTKIVEKAKRWQDYIDFYLNISNDKEREILKTKFTEIFDGYYIKDSVNGTEDEYHKNEKRRWATKNDESYTAIKDFFGPVGAYYLQSPRKDNAYAIRSLQKILFDNVDLIGFEGGSTLNHELVHAYDEDVLLKGYGYREGQDTESYAYGLFESVTSDNTYYYGFNFMYDLANGVHNNNIDRFKTKQDIKDYIHGVSDVTYLIDGIEAEVLIGKTDAEKAKLFRKMELVLDDNYTSKDNIFYRHGKDKISDLTEADIKAMKLKDVKDLVRNNLVSNTSFMTSKEYLRDNNNNYYIVPLYYPIYAAYENRDGTVGGLMFRRVAFDLLAEYGWDEGFIPYASSKYRDELKPSFKPLSDTYIFGKIFNGKYTSYSDFKEKMFKERLDKKNDFKAITIDGQTIDSYEKLKKLIEDAVNDDLSKADINMGFARAKLKEKILREFNKLTNNFRESIFK